MLQSQQHIKTGARRDSKGKADMKLVGTGKKLGSSVLIKERDVNVQGCHREFLVLWARLFRWNRPSEQKQKWGLPLECCKCVIPTCDKEILPQMFTQSVGILGDCFGKRGLVF